MTKPQLRFCQELGVSIVKNWIKVTYGMETW